jgi:hypothetical protein
LARHFTLLKLRRRGHFPFTIFCGRQINPYGDEAMRFSNLPRERIRYGARLESWRMDFSIGELGIHCRLDDLVLCQDFREQ